MVNVLGLGFWSPVPSSMIILEICLLCDWQALLLTKMVRLNQNLHLLPHQRQGKCTPKTGEVQYSNQQWVGSHCVRGNSKVLWVEVFFFQIIFVLMYFDLYMTYIYLFIYDYIYIYIYNYIYIPPSFGLWGIFMHSLQRRLWSYALRTFITIRMCQLKCSTGNNDSLKAL